MAEAVSAAGSWSCQDYTPETAADIHLSESTPDYASTIQAFVWAEERGLMNITIPLAKVFTRDNGMGCLSSDCE